MTNESIISDYMESESSFLLHGNIYDLEGIHQSGYTKFSDIRDWMLENSARSCQSSTNISIIDDWFDACQIYIPYDSYNLFKTKHLLLPDVKKILRTSITSSHTPSFIGHYVVVTSAYAFLPALLTYRINRTSIN